MLSTSFVTAAERPEIAIGDTPDGGNRISVSERDVLLREGFTSFNYQPGLVDVVSASRIVDVPFLRALNQATFWEIKLDASGVRDVCGYSDETVYRNIFQFQPKSIPQPVWDALQAWIDRIKGGSRAQADMNSLALPAAHYR